MKISSLALLLASLCVASAFMAPGAPLRAPAQQAPVARAAAPEMALGEAAAAPVLAAVGTAIATSAGDFGGMTIPIVGLGVLAATIALLAGPVED